MLFFPSCPVTVIPLALGRTFVDFTWAAVAVPKHLPPMFGQECLPFAPCEATECDAWHPLLPPLLHFFFTWFYTTHVEGPPVGWPPFGLTIFPPRLNVKTQIGVQTYQVSLISAQLTVHAPYRNEWLWNDLSKAQSFYKYILSIHISQEIICILCAVMCLSFLLALDFGSDALPDRQVTWERLALTKSGLIWYHSMHLQCTISNYVK